LNVVKFHGTVKERPDLQDKIRYLMKTGSLDIILVSVTAFQKEKSDDRTFLRNIEFDYMVVDEAHSLSNAKNIRYRSMDKFKTLHRLLLTVCAKRPSVFSGIDRGHFV
jgi:SNF2 family DNA or RNA helicase